MGNRILKSNEQEEQKPKPTNDKGVVEKIDNDDECQSDKSNNMIIHTTSELPNNVVNDKNDNDTTTLDDVVVDSSNTVIAIEHNNNNDDDDDEEDDDIINTTRNNNQNNNRINDNDNETTRFFILPSFLNFIRNVSSTQQSTPIHQSGVIMNDDDHPSPISISPLRPMNQLFFSTPFNNVKNTTKSSSSRQVHQPMDVVGNELEIEEGTPADKALKANAKVKVTRVGKAARYMNAQTIRKLWNRQFGNIKGKPPRVPQRRWSDNDIGMEPFGVLDGLSEGSEEDEMDDDDDDDDEYDDEGEEILVKRSPEMGPRRMSHHELDSIELSHHDFQEIPKTGTEDDPDATYVGYDSSKFGEATIALHDKHGKKQDLRIMFDKFKRINTTRANTRRGRKEASRNYVKGKVIEEEHELYTLSIAVMLGLRYAIYQTHLQLENDKKDKRFWLDSEEFMRMEKYVFRPDGRYKTPPHKLGHTFKFKDYAPVPFAYIRRMFGINEYEFIHSVCGNANFIEFISNAKSGQFFFYSNDGKYMIKTMTNTESKFLRRILPHYFRHCAQNPNTLMTKFLGMYRVKLYHLQRNVKFIVMNSVFDTDKLLASFYDLKGSRMGRNSKPNESVKKDNDVRKMMEIDPNNGFILPPSVRARLREQVVRDCNFLKEMKIMDYSMLIGVHYIPSSAAGKSGDSIRGLIFRDSESVRSAFKPRKKQIQNAVTKPVNLQNPRSESSAITKNFHRVNTPIHSNISPLVENRKMMSGFKDEPSVDDEILSDVLLEEKPSHLTLSPKSPFIVNEIEKVTGLSSDQSVMSASTLGFDDEDSILLQKPLHSPVSEDSAFDWRKEKLDIDLRREIAIEQSYWPFHRYYEINGQRRVIPINEMYRTSVGANNLTENATGVESGESSCISCVCNHTKFDPDLAAARRKWQLKDFEEPISNRKDNGLTMDVTSIKLPMKVTSGKQTQECDGKIFYMGIIDILQQFNVRKRMEARYRRIKGGGWDGASCVHPEFYADRFVEFFDEYTSRGNVKNVDSLHDGGDDDDDEEEEDISFESIQDSL